MSFNGIGRLKLKQCSEDSFFADVNFNWTEYESNLDQLNDRQLKMEAEQPGTGIREWEARKIDQMIWTAYRLRHDWPYLSQMDRSKLVELIESTFDAYYLVEWKRLSNDSQVIAAINKQLNVLTKKRKHDQQPRPTH